MDTVIVNTEKKSIVLTGLAEFSSQLVISMDEIQNVNQLPEAEEKYTYIANLVQKDGVDSQINWAYSDKSYTGKAKVISLEQLQEVKFQNNLDTLVDYEEGFTAHVIICFATLYFVQEHLKREKVYFICQDEQTLVYV